MKGTYNYYIGSDNIQTRYLLVNVIKQASKFLSIKLRLDLIQI